MSYMYTEPDNIQYILAHIFNQCHTTKELQPLARPWTAEILYQVSQFCSIDARCCHSTVCSTFSGQVSFTHLLNLHWSSLLHSFARPSLVKSIPTRVGGPAQKNAFFSNAPPKSFLSVPIYSIRCEYDILKVSLKKIDQNLPVGCVKHWNVPR
jgi:hypothetical protein